MKDMTAANAKLSEKDVEDYRAEYEKVRNFRLKTKSGVIMQIA
jgi:hypothetical protein